MQILSDNDAEGKAEDERLELAQKHARQAERIARRVRILAPGETENNPSVHEAEQTRQREQERTRSPEFSASQTQHRQSAMIYQPPMVIFVRLIYSARSLA